MAEDNIGLLSLDKMDVSHQMNQEIDNEAKLLLKEIHFTLFFILFKGILTKSGRSVIRT
jgi:hypothetical protein